MIRDDAKQFFNYHRPPFPPHPPHPLPKNNTQSPEWRTERTQATHKMITGLAAGTTYEVQIRAKNIAGWSDFCELVTVSTPNAKREVGEEEEVSLA